MAAYVIMTIEVTDREQFELFLEQVPATVKRHGGRRLVSGEDITVLEGDQLGPRIAVMEFDSKEQASDWYNSDDYAGPKELRTQSTISNMVIVEGLPAE